MAKKQEQKSILDTLRKNWYLALFIGATILAWGNLQNDTTANKIAIESLKVEIEKLEQQREEDRDQVSAIEGDIKEIKANILFIRENINK